MASPLTDVYCKCSNHYVKPVDERILMLRSVGRGSLHTLVQLRPWSITCRRLSRRCMEEAVCAFATWIQQARFGEHAVPI